MADDRIAPLFDLLDEPPAPGFEARLRRRLVAELTAATAADLDGPEAVPMAPGPGGGPPRRGRRRATRWWPVLAPVATAVLLVAVVAGGAGPDGSQRVRVGPGATVPTTETTEPPAPSTTGPATTGPATTVPATTVPAGATTAYPGIWPFASPADEDAYAASGDRTYADPVVTARQFATRYLGMDHPTVFAFRSTGPGEGEVPIGPGLGEEGRRRPSPAPSTFVVVRQVAGGGGPGPWTVVGAHAPSIQLDSPTGVHPLTSPLTLVGRATAFEGTVNVEVREDGMVAGQALGRSVVTAAGTPDGHPGPFRGGVAFRPPSQGAGALVLFEASAASDQGLVQATVVRIRFARRGGPR